MAEGTHAKQNSYHIARPDHLRFAAAAAVVLFHSYITVLATSTRQDTAVIPLIQQGHRGVQLFMVISGTILTLIAADDEIALAKFHLNRILRIYPPFVFVVTLGYFSTPVPRPTSDTAGSSGAGAAGHGEIRPSARHGMPFGRRDPRWIY